MEFPYAFVGAIVAVDPAFSARIEKAGSAFFKAKGVACSFVKSNALLSFVNQFEPQYSLIFLGIQSLGDFAQIERLHCLDSHACLVICHPTATYALQGYKVGVSSYLTTEASDEDLSSLFEKVSDVVLKGKARFLHFRVDGQIESVCSDDLYYLSIYNHDLTIVASDKEWHLTGSLSNYEKALEAFGFYRASACYLVNLRKVEQFVDGTLFLKGVKIPVSRAKRLDLRRHLAELAPSGGPAHE